MEKCMLFGKKTASHPIWMRGLKYIIKIGDITRPIVASYMDAWIEINRNLVFIIKNIVASYMDAWIEIFMHYFMHFWAVSHPIWMRGLKYVCNTPYRMFMRRILYGCVD